MVIILILLLPSIIFALRWPSPDNRVTCGFGWRMALRQGHFIRDWHEGIDIGTNHGSVALLSINDYSSSIERIETQRGYGNVIEVGGWKYSHLANSNLPSWRWGTDDFDNRYFAIMDSVSRQMVYYSLSRRLQWYNADQTITEVIANQSVEPHVLFAYSGNTGASRAPHLHLQHIPDTESPLKSLVHVITDLNYSDYDPPINPNDPVVSNVQYYDFLGILSAESDTGNERDINKYEVLVNGVSRLNISFDPRQNSEESDYSLGNGTGIRAGVSPNFNADCSQSMQCHTIYFEWDEGRSCRANNTPLDVFVRAYDVENKIGIGRLQQARNAVGPSPTCPPGGDNADDNYSVSATTSASLRSDGDDESDEPDYSNPNWLEPSVAVFTNAYLSELRGLLRNSRIIFGHKSGTPSEQDIANSKLLIFPTGGLNGMSGSEFFRQGLADYVWSGGNVLVFAQQYGYDYAALPTPNGVPIQAYGWAEDQSCQHASVYFDDWHQTLSALTKAVPSINVDGYFTSYPDYSKVLLRRIKNDQPAAILYQYGNGHVIATTMYSDYGAGTSQAFAEERNVVRDMVNWIVHPVGLPETAPNGIVSLEVPIFNNTDTDAAGVRIRVYNPDRTALLKEESHEMDLPIGSAVPIPMEYQTFNPALGIYHVDYSLVDALGDTIYPHVALDAARFAVAAPPENPHVSHEFRVSIQADAEHYVYGDPVAVTINIWNNTAQGRNVTANWDLVWNNYSDSRSFYIAGNSMETITAAVPHVIHSGNLGVTVRDEAGAYLATAKKGVWPTYPKAYAERLATDAELYDPSETVYLDAAIKNYIHLDWPATVRIAIVDPLNVQVFSEEQNHTLQAFATQAVQAQFQLQQGMPTGTYTVKLDAYFQDPILGTPKLIASRATTFSIQASKLEIVPGMPAVLNGGPITVPFNLRNVGRVDVQSGTLTVKLKGPDGTVLNTETRNFGG